MNPFNPEIAPVRPPQPLAAVLEKAADDETKALIPETEEASKIFTSSLIIGSLPIERPLPALPELDLSKLHTYLFTAEEKIRDAESGGSQILFKMRPKLNFLQTTSLEEFWKKWNAIRILQERHSSEIGNFAVLISSFATDDLLRAFDQLLYAALCSQSFEEFKVHYENNQEVDLDEVRNGVLDMFHGSHHILKTLGYSMDVREDAVFFTVPDPRLLNFRLNALYEERPLLPRVKIGYHGDDIGLMDFIKKFAIKPGCSDVLVSTGKNFFGNMTFHLLRAIALTLDAEANKDDSYITGMAAFRNSVAHHYTLINRVEDKIHQHRTASYHYFGGSDPEFEKELWDKGIPAALRLAKLNLAVFIILWLVDTSLEELNNMTKEKVENLLVGGHEFNKMINYSSQFAKHKVEFNRDKIVHSWHTLQEFLNP